MCERLLVGCLGLFLIRCTTAHTGFPRRLGLLLRCYSCACVLVQKKTSCPSSQRGEQEGICISVLMSYPLFNIPSYILFRGGGELAHIRVCRRACKPKPFVQPTRTPLASHLAVQDDNFRFGSSSPPTTAAHLSALSISLDDLGEFDVASMHPALQAKGGKLEMFLIGRDVVFPHPTCTLGRIHLLCGIG